MGTNRSTTSTVAAADSSASTSTTRPVLGPDQAARAEALNVARRVLTGSQVMSTPELPEHRTVTNLYDLAEYVILGRNPLSDWVTAGDRAENLADQVAFHVVTAFSETPHDQTDLTNATPLPTAEVELAELRSELRTMIFDLRAGPRTCGGYVAQDLQQLLDGER